MYCYVSYSCFSMLLKSVLRYIIFNSEYLSSVHYIYVSNYVRIRGCFPKPKGVREQKCPGKKNDIRYTFKLENLWTGTTLSNYVFSFENYYPFCGSCLIKLCNQNTKVNIYSQILFYGLENVVVNVICIASETYGKSTVVWRFTCKL
jgi:hypothetical protein